MPTSIFQRLIWKELRQQRLFWLCVAGGALCLLPLAYLWRESFIRDRSAYWFGVSTYLPILFALGSCAMSFALEREDGTDVLLCRFAPPPGKLLAAKLSFAFAATFAMWVVLASVAGLLIAIDAGIAGFWAGVTNAPDSFWRRGDDDNNAELWRHIRQHVPIALAWLAQLTAWGTLLSLVSRRVVNGLIGALVASAVTNPSVTLVLEHANRDRDLLNDGQLHFTADVLRIGVIPLLLLAISAWLVRRWQEDRWPAVIERGLERLRRVLTRSDNIAALEWELLEREHALRANVRSLGVPRAEDVGRELATESRTSVATSRAGWGWLIRDDRWSPTARAATRLLWVEIRRAKKVVAIAIAICAGMLVFSICLPQNVRLGSPLAAHPLPFELLVLCSFACGLSTFLPEHRQLPFLTHHAVSPTAVWGLKQLVWWPAAVLIATFVFLLVAATHGSDIRDDDWRSVFAIIEGSHSPKFTKSYGDALQYFIVAPLIRQTLWLTTFDELASRSSFWLMIVSRWFAFVTSSFLIGQFMSVAVPRGVAAAVLGLFLIAVGISWCALMTFLHVPLSLCVAPLCVALLLASCVRCRAWVDEWSRWRTTVRVGLALLLPGLATYCGIGWYRVAEVPPLRWSEEVRWEERAGQNDVVRSPAQHVPTTAAELSPERLHPETTRFRQEVMRHVPDLPPIPNAPDSTASRSRPERGRRIWDQNRWSKDVGDWARENAELTRRLVAISQQNEFGFITASRALEPWFFNFQWLTNRIEVMAFLLHLDALNLAQTGEWDESLERVQALFRLSQHERVGGGTSQLELSLHIENAALDSLAFWASRPNVTAERLEHARDLIKDRWGLSEEALVTLALDGDRQLYERLFDHAWNTQMDLRAVSWLAPWERERSRRLMELSLVSDWQLALGGRIADSWERRWYYSYGARSWETRSATRRILRQRMESLVQRSTGLNLTPEFGSMSLTYRKTLEQIGELVTAVEARRVGCRLLLDLRKHQLTHGQLPELLDELMGDDVKYVPIDPFTFWGEEISYWPHGLPLTIAFANGTVTEGTPCFFLRGPLYFRLRRTLDTPKDGPPIVTWISATGERTPTDGGITHTQAVAYPLGP